MVAGSNPAGGAHPRWPATTTGRGGPARPRVSSRGGDSQPSGRRTAGRPSCSHRCWATASGNHSSLVTVNTAHLDPHVSSLGEAHAIVRCLQPDVATPNHTTTTNATIDRPTSGRGMRLRVLRRILRSEPGVTCRGICPGQHPSSDLQRNGHDAVQRAQTTGGISETADQSLRTP